MATKAQLNWTDGFQFVARAENGPGLVLDSTDGGSGPTPMQMVLMGVAGCTAMDVVSILSKMKVTPDYFNIRVSGDLTEEHPKYYHTIHIIYEYRGDVPEKKIQRAIELSQERYCGVSALLKRGCTLTYEITKLD